MLPAGFSRDWCPLALWNLICRLTLKSLPMPYINSTFSAILGCNPNWWDNICLTKVCGSYLIGCSSQVQPCFRGRRAGSFPEQRLAIESTNGSAWLVFGLYFMAFNFILYLISLCCMAFNFILYFMAFNFILYVILFRLLSPSELIWYKQCSSVTVIFSPGWCW